MIPIMKQLEDEETTENIKVFVRIRCPLPFERGKQIIVSVGPDVGLILYNPYRINKLS
jgi:hypothetical protein